MVLTFQSCQEKLAQVDQNHPAVATSQRWVQDSAPIDLPTSPDILGYAMNVSRDEAREIAIIGILAAIAFRIVAGLVQLIEEATGEWTYGSLVGRLVAPIGSTIGILALAAVLITVLSPNGSVTRGVATATRATAGVVAWLGVLASVYTLGFAPNDLLTRLWFALINGMTATALAGTGYVISRNFENRR